MATVIRFARHGSKKRPFYRIVVADSRNRRDGRFIEKLGTFDAVRGEKLTIARDRLEYWLSVGAQMSDTVRTRLNIHEKFPEGIPQPGRTEKKGYTAPKPPAPKEEAAPAAQAEAAAEAPPQDKAEAAPETKPEDGGSEPASS